MHEGRRQGGLGPRKTFLLSVRGRRSGACHTTPVNLVVTPEARYLVAPYGTTSWVKNARTAGRVRLRRGRTAQDCLLEAVEEPSEAARILHRYWRENAITRPFFDVPAHPTDAAFLPELPGHPVFKLHTVE